MFDVGFWELLLIAVLGLLVLGPERLPQVARSVGLWAGKARAYVRQLSTELDREMQAEELRRSLQSGQQTINDAKQSLASALDEPAQSESAGLESSSKLKPKPEQGSK